MIYILRSLQKFFPSRKRPDCIWNAPSSLVTGWRRLFLRGKEAIGCSWTPITTPKYTFTAWYWYSANIHK